MIRWLVIVALAACRNDASAVDDKATAEAAQQAHDYAALEAEIAEQMNLVVNSHDDAERTAARMKLLDLRKRELAWKKRLQPTDCTREPHAKGCP